MGGNHMAWLAVALVATGSLAGCSDKTGGTSSDPNGSNSPLDPEDLDDEAKKGGGSATATTGFIQGIVVDQGIRPLGNVSINVVSPGKVAQNAVTGANGVFVFQGLAPSTYIVRAQKEAYSDAQTSVEVKAGDDDPPVVKLQMSIDVGKLPSAVLYTFEGYIECDVNVFGNEVTCDTLGPAGIHNNTVDRSWAVKGNVSYIQAVLDWTPTTPASDNMYLQLTDLSGNGWLNYGPSPVALTLNGNAATLYNNGFAVHVQAAAGAATPVVGAGANAGAAWEQTFKVFVVVCQNFEPPSGYLFTRDGEPKVPPPPA